MRHKILAALILAIALPSWADEDLTVQMNLVDENGVVASIGSIALTENKFGVVFTPNLSGLPTGLHGFHVHENPSCDAKEKDGKKTPALAAGGHYDPLKSGKHGTPWGDGHLGDLPPMYVNAEGKSMQAVLAPRLKLSDLAGRSLMIHAGGDNHADHPAMLGGGGMRLACGVLK